MPITSDYSGGAANFTAQLAGLFAGVSTANRELDARNRATDAQMLDIMLNRDTRLAELSAQNAARRDANALRSQEIALAREESAYARLDKALDHRLKLAELDRKDRDAAFQKSLQLKAAHLETRRQEHELRKMDMAEQVPLHLAAIRKAGNDAATGQVTSAWLSVRRNLETPAMEAYLQDHPDQRAGFDQLQNTLLQMTDTALLNVETGETLDLKSHIKEVSMMDFDKLADGHQTLRQIQILGAIQHDLGKANPSKAEVVGYLKTLGVSGGELDKFARLDEARYAKLFSREYPSLDRNAVLRANAALFSLAQQDQAWRASRNPMMLDNPAVYEAWYKSRQRRAVAGIMGMAPEEAAVLEPKQTSLRAHTRRMMDTWADRVTPHIKYQKRQAVSLLENKQFEHVRRIEENVAALGQALSSGSGDPIRLLSEIADELQRYNDFDPGHLAGNQFEHIKREARGFTPQHITLDQVLSASSNAELSARIAIFRQQGEVLSTDPATAAQQIMGKDPSRYFYGGSSAGGASIEQYDLTTKAGTATPQ